MIDTSEPSASIERLRMLRADEATLRERFKSWQLKVSVIEAELSAQQHGAGAQGCDGRAQLTPEQQQIRAALLERLGP